MSKIVVSNQALIRIRPGFELNDDEDYKLKRGERYYSSLDGEYRGLVDGFTRKTAWTLFLMYGYFVVREKRLKTPEEKKLAARNFVNENIDNPKEETYKKFEEAFLVDNDFGL